MFGTTYSAHPIGCAAVAAYLQFCDAYNVWENVRNNADDIAQMFRKHGWFFPIRYRGYLFGLSLPRSLPNLHLRAREACFKRDVHVYTKGGTVNGNGNYVTVAPALEMPAVLIEDGIAKICEAMGEVLGNVKQEHSDDH